MDIKVHIDPRHAWWQNLLEEAAKQLAAAQVEGKKYSIELEDAPDAHDLSFKFRVTNKEPYREDEYDYITVPLSDVLKVLCSNG